MGRDYVFRVSLRVRSASGIAIGVVVALSVTVVLLVVTALALGAGEALLHIRRASRDVLDELTGMLTVLREPQALATLAPAPGYAAIGGTTFDAALGELVSAGLVAVEQAGATAVVSLRLNAEFPQVDDGR